MSKQLWSFACSFQYYLGWWQRVTTSDVGRQKTSQRNCCIYISLKNENKRQTKWAVLSYGGAAVRKAESCHIGDVFGEWLSVHGGEAVGLRRWTWAWAGAWAEQGPWSALSVLIVTADFACWVQERPLGFVGCVCLFPGEEWGNYLYVFPNIVLYLYILKYRSNNRDVQRITVTTC